jgi:hypothetical protein
MRPFVLAYFFGVGVVCAIGLDGVVTLTCRVAPALVAPGAC